MQHEKYILSTVDAILVQANAHDRGRPSKAQELEIERILRPFFTKLYSATFTAKKTGFDIKTVAKYFAEFKKEILESETTEFVQRSRETKERGLLAYDELLYSLYNDKEEVEHLIDVAKKIADLRTVEKWYRIKMKINKDITEVIAAKINLENTATVDDIAKILQGEKQK